MEAKKEKTRVDIAGFISERFKNLMLEEGYSNNVVDSVLSTGFDNILDSYNKIKALEKFKKQKGFAELAAVFKRVVNIIKEKPVARLDPSLFKDNSERKLHEVFVDINEKANNYNEGVTTKADYTEILKEIKKLKKPVDNFFNSVLVMDKDERLKNNRLALLNEIKTSSSVSVIFPEFSCYKTEINLTTDVYWSSDTIKLLHSKFRFSFVIVPIRV